MRPAEAGDRDQVWPLARDLATSYVLERAAFDRSFASLLAAPDALVLVAEPGAVAGSSGKVVGYLLATSHPAFHANGPVAWIEEVMVAAETRAAGVGRQLMAAAETWARARGAAYVALATRRAAPFYQALGYEDSAVYFKKTLGWGARCLTSRSHGIPAGRSAWLVQPEGRGEILDAWLMTPHGIGPSITR